MPLHSEFLLKSVIFLKLNIDLRVCSSLFKSVVGGMLDIEPQLWRKPRPEKFDEQRRKVLAFAKQYEPFDPAPRS